MPDLSTRYMGLELRNPLVASSSPLCEHIDQLREMEDNGAAAVVLHSLFEEQIELASSALHQQLSRGVESYPESLSYFPDLQDYNLGPDGYLEYVAKTKAALDIPVIGSLNGCSPGGWVEFAKRIQEAGADALELNMYYLPTDPGRAAAEVEAAYIELIREVKAQVTIPLAVKIGPYFTAMAHTAREFDHAGASALVLFNRFYQPDLDIETLDVKPDLHLSAPYELRLRLRWVAILHGHVQADLAVTGGVHSAEDVLKSMMAGARVAMMTSALLIHGIGHFARVRQDLLQWMEEHEYDSIQTMQGSMSQKSIAQPDLFERANYLRVLTTYSRRLDEP